MNEARLKMELHKVDREIRTHGSKFNVYRDKKDKYGEDTGEQEFVCVISGLFHISKGYVSKNVTEGTVTHSKGQPMLMCHYSETGNIKTGDYVIINGNKYKVVEKNNIQEYSIVTDISLELMLYDRV